MTALRSSGRKVKDSAKLNSVAAGQIASKFNEAFIKFSVFFIKAEFGPLSTAIKVI